MNLSAIILSKNEEQNIVRAIRSVSFCDEVFLIDDNSTDLTRVFAQKLGANVYQRSLANDFAAQRNFALAKVKKGWVLFLDADEEVSKSLGKEIRKKISDPRNITDGFYIKRRDIIWGKILNYGENGNTKLLRLAKVGSGEWKRRVHETWDIKGEVGTLDNILNHHSHPTIKNFIEHINYMSTLHAEENLSEGKKSNLIKITLWPKLKFINNYILKLGFLDGVYGFVAAIIMSFHSYLSWGKLWLMQKSINKAKF